MGVLDKVMFWKKEPKLDIDTNLDFNSASAGPNLGMPSSPNLGLPPTGPSMGIDSNPGLTQQQMHDPFLDGGAQPSFQTPQTQPAFGAPEQPKIISESTQGFPQQNLHQESYDKSLEIVSMKLDNLKVVLENMNQRLMNIERIATDSQRQEPKRPNW